MNPQTAELIGLIANVAFILASIEVLALAPIGIVCLLRIAFPSQPRPEAWPRKDAE